jgi:hypothetical protein
MDDTDPGYAIVERFFEPVEMTQVLDSLSYAGLERTKAGARHVLRVPEIRALANDPRLTELASQFLDRGAVPFRATLFDKSSEANWLVVWHQDTALPLRTRVDAPEWGPWSVKAGMIYAHAPAWALERVVALRVSLDDSSATNGPLRILPNSHREGVLTDEQIERLARTVPPVDCVAKAGGIVVLRPLTVHASSKSVDDKPRRVLHIEYADSLRLSSDIELAVA